MQKMNQRWYATGLAALMLGALVSCDASEPNPVHDDTGVANPSTAESTDGTVSPTVAPPSGVDAGTKTPSGKDWSAPDDHKQTRFLGMVADKPVTWIEHPPATSMELTRFTVPGKDDNPAAEIVVFFFGAGMGGSLDDNIARWQNQFRPNDDGSLLEPEITNLSAGDDIEVTLVEFIGDWLRMGAASYTNDQHFITAIVDSPSGMLFIRFVGLDTTVGPNRAAFVEMMESLRADDEASE